MISSFVTRRGPAVRMVPISTSSKYMLEARRVALAACSSLVAPSVIVIAAAPWA
jgi:hypothetical protein